MRRWFLRQSPDLAIWGVGLLAVIGNATWVISQSSAIDRLRQTTASPRLASVERPARRAATPLPVAEHWPDPALGSRGEGWNFDVFTSPTLYRDARTQQWSLTPPAPLVVETEEPAAPREVDFGVEVVAIGLGLFPLQLVGFGGPEDRYFGTFEIVATQETFLARAGRRVDDLGILIQQLSVERAKTPQLEGEPLTQVVASAMVLNESTGEKTRLTSSERVVVDGPAVQLKNADFPAPRWFRENDEFEASGARFRVTKIDVSQRVVEVIRLSASGEEPVQKTFSPPVVEVSARQFYES